MKQFVKAKPLGQQKEKQPPQPYPRQSKRNNRKYEEKSAQQPKDPRDHIKMIINQYKAVQKTPIVLKLCSKFPKIFSATSLKPQPQIQGNIVDFLWFPNKKQNGPRAAKQMSSDSSDPDWDSDEDKQVKLVSKKIDQSVVQKVNNLTSKQAPKKLDQLQRYQKQFLQEYYRQRRQQQHHTTVADTKQKQSEHKAVVTKMEPKKQQQIVKQNAKQENKQEEQDWAEYDPNVGALITQGVIQKIQKQEDDFEMDEDFSYESQKSQKQSSSDDDDDMFADEGPRTVTKTKQDKRQDQQNENKQQNKSIVQISSHLFTQIAEQVGLHPEACIWVISNKLQRFRVSTQYMNEYYKNAGLSAAFPYVSLNHSQFVHVDEIQTDKGLDKFKRFSDRRKHKIQNKNYNYNNNTNNNYVRNTSQNQGNTRPQPPHYKQKK